MNLIVFSFWNVVVLVFFGFLLIGTLQMVRWLGSVSVLAINFLTRAGLHQVAKFVLATMVNYTRKTYCKNRMIYWNQVSTRFSFLWGSVFILAYILMLLKFGHKVDSISLPLVSMLGLYLGYRCLMYWLSQDVNEQSCRPHQYPSPIIRQWDYLDELFADPA